MAINLLSAQYAYLRNSYEVHVLYDGLLYLNSEAAFQAQKLLNIENRKYFTNLDGKTAKYISKKVKKIPKWNDKKIDIMTSVLICKFKQNPDLRQQLIDTGDEQIINHSITGDVYWGVVNDKGKNMLGQILMHVREVLR